jgi:hypothetical protein
MNTVRRLLALSAALALLTASSARAQLLQFTFAGTLVTRDASGNLISVPLNNTRLLHFFAPNMGVSTTTGLELVYHVAGSDLGDTIDVINAKTGTFVSTMFGLYFGEDQTLGRAGLSDAAGRNTRRVEYMYDYQNSHSMGSALIATHYRLDSSGNTNSVSASGQMQFVLLPAGNATSVSVCNGTFVTGKALVFP